MKIICTQENLNKGLNLVSHIANKNNNLPILSNVLLKANKEGLTLITTDLEIGIKVFVRSKVVEEGDFTIDAKLLNNYVSFLPKENINLNLKEGSLEVKSEKQETSIKGLDAEDFPLIPEIEKNNEVLILAADLKKALNQVLFAASLDGSRIEINAINFNFCKETLTMAATDSYRLAEKKIKINNQSKEVDLIIPLKTLQELNRIIAEQPGENLKLYFNENQILFVFDGVELVSRVIDGCYPDYKQIIPSNFITKAKCDLNRLVPAIKAVSLFCKQGINDIKLSFEQKSGEIIVSTTSSQTGNSVARVSAEIVGENNDTVFNYRYLLDGLNNIDSSQIYLQLNNSSSPGLIQPSDNQEYIYLIMPIRQ